MKPLVLDLESYYDSRISVQEMCLQRYWSESYVYLLSMVTAAFKWVGTPEELFRDPIAMGHLLDPQFDLWAVNSNFDQTGTETFFPEVAGRRWQCVSDFAVSHQRPRNLAELHEILTGEKVSKRIRGSMKGVHYSEIMEFDRERIRDYNLLDSQQALQDIGELTRQCGPMSPVEEAVAEHTRMISRRGMAFDEEFIGKCREALYWVRHNAAKEMPWVAEGEKALAAQAFNTFCCKKGVAPPANLQKDAADFTAWMEANPTLAPFLKARQRYELANRKLSHIEKFLSRTFEGVYYPDLLYCGAPHTRRWSSKGSSDGSEGGDDTHSGFNLQNMDREPLFGDILTDFFSPLPPQRDGKPMPGIFFRNFIVPRPGKVFIILDFEQIEPRCLAWLVGNETFLQKIREGYGVYEAFARAFLNWMEGVLKKENPELYKLAKAEVLGLGYGCGYKKFPLVAWKMAQLKISLERSQDTVFSYRRDNPKTVGFWGDMQRAVEEAAHGDGLLNIQMPNGEIMWRFKVQQYIKNNLDGSQRYAFAGAKILGSHDPKNLQDIYGAKIVENITQRMARDLLAEAVINLEAAGIPVCFHAHDEVIVEVDEADKADALLEARQIMQTTPEWATGLPIGASGGIFSRYTKD